MTTKQNQGTPMTKGDAARIQSAADRNDSNHGFARRAQSAADRPARAPAAEPAKKPSGGK
jgi:hypothetical protein